LKKSQSERLKLEIEGLRERMESNTRRIEELEATAFTLSDEEEVVLVAVPRKISSGIR